MCFDASGRLLAQAGDPWPDAAVVAGYFPQVLGGPLPRNGLMGHWPVGDDELFISVDPVLNAAGTRLGTVAGITRLPAQLTLISSEIQRETQKYNDLARERKAVKRNYLSMLWLLTLLILFMATWFALFLSKQVTIPIQALAKATHEVSQGNLGFQIVARADDELGVLVSSFNQMTLQLLENRRAIDHASLKLQEANRQLEERGNTIEAILENIPTGVISFDPQGQITRLNSTAERMMGGAAIRSARVLSDLFSPEDAREISRMFRRAARQGVVTQQMELDLGGRRAYVALTLSFVQARHGRVGSVLVLEDLTEVLQAQRSAAWQEVAQRIAHEIKNPLTPIQLSTERILRLIERTGAAPPSPELLAAVGDSASLIGREVGTLKTLVDEFSAFARFPTSKPVPSPVNDILENALNVFAGRLHGIDIHRDLAAGLPVVQADPDQMKRVLVNLIDNAAEALEQSLRKEIWVRSALNTEGDTVEITVADSGPGIPPEAKERLFLPFFSTKRTGTGLGLAIVSRIVAEHHGSIRAEENLPTGSKFVIELPVERTPAEPAAAREMS
jgi:PAS domain S-box-containing protein